MVSKNNKLSIVQQCPLLNVNRSSVYHRVTPPSDDDLKLMTMIDKIHLSRPFLGVRRITDSLRDGGEATITSEFIG
jgi:putative transposase